MVASSRRVLGRLEFAERGLSGETGSAHDTGASWLSIACVCTPSDSAIENQERMLPGEKFVRRLPAYHSRFELLVAIDVAAQPLQRNKSLRLTGRES
jgi:hypothetical protein